MQVEGLENLHALYKEAVDLWGSEAQLDMVVEECAELIHAIQKAKRSKGTDIVPAQEHIICEAVDALICIGQLPHILGVPIDIFTKQHEKVYCKLKEKIQLSKRKKETSQDCAELRSPTK